MIYELVARLLIGAQGIALLAFVHRLALEEVHALIN